MTTERKAGTVVTTDIFLIEYTKAEETGGGYRK